MLNSFPRIKQSFLEFSPVLLKASLVAQTVNNLPAMQETWVRSLSEEDPSEEEIATHSSILGWRIPWTEEPGGLQSVGLQRVGHDWVTDTVTATLLLEVGLGNVEFWRSAPPPVCISTLSPMVTPSGFSAQRRSHPPLYHRVTWLAWLCIPAGRSASWTWLSGALAVPSRQSGSI